MTYYFENSLTIEQMKIEPINYIHMFISMIIH